MLWDNRTLSGEDMLNKTYFGALRAPRE